MVGVTPSEERNGSLTAALFAVSFSHLHWNETQRGCEAISGSNYKISRNFFTYMLYFIIMQMSRVNREKGYWLTAPTKRSRYIKSKDIMRHYLCEYRLIVGCFLAPPRQCNNRMAVVFAFMDSSFLFRSILYILLHSFECVIVLQLRTYPIQPLVWGR